MLLNSLTCKICGGDAAAEEERAVCVCGNCGAEGILPKSDIKKLNRVTYFRNRLDFEAGRRSATS